jgi:hypothetical protein
MLAFQHPDPDWTPRLAWGDPIPLQWVRVSAGLWFVWPPRQFETIEPDGRNVWRRGSLGSYEPARACRTIPPNAEAPSYETKKAAPTQWGGSLHACWRKYDDGRAFVTPGELEVSLPPSRILFKFARSFGQHVLDYYYPGHIWDPPISPPSPWASCSCGYLSPPEATQRRWRYPTPDGRRWLANAWIEPAGITITPLPSLPPLKLPSDSEVEQEEHVLRKVFSLEDGQPLHVRPHPLMLRDLGASAKLLDLVGEDAFAGAFESFVRHNEFLHEPTGQMVDFNSDNNGAWMLSVLRRYGEGWQDCEYLQNPKSIDFRATVEELFREAGYAVYTPPPVDEDARREDLKNVFRTMPASIGQLLLEKSHLSFVMAMAWAMGHFWSEDEGWTEPELPLSSEYRSLVGGHLGAAGEIAKMIEADEI